ncbi:MAG: HAD-IB family phosphatase [bacterium]|nr:HAD-IB family phosphatase [bacterium]
MHKQKRVAIFDIDGTIFRSSLLVELVDAFVQEGVFKPDVAKAYDKAHKQWLDRKGDYQAYLFGVINAYEKNLKGVAYKDFERVAHKVAAFQKNRVYRFTSDLVKELKKKDYYVLAISNSPLGIVSEFCKNWGFDKVYGRVYEINERRKFTGKTLFLELIKDKAKVLERAVAIEGLTLKGSVGVGDTESDIPLLKVVDRPICFNPNEKLYRYATRAGWEIVVERKDVIYKL